MNQEKMINVEQQAFYLMKTIWKQIQAKKLIARIITFAVIAFAIYQELFTVNGLNNSWYEITLYLIMGYFTMATFRCTFNIDK